MRSLQKSVPYLRFKAAKTGTWANPGNIHDVEDNELLDNSVIVIMHTSAYNGRWRVSAISAGVSFRIISSDPEDSGTTFSYEIL